MKFTYQGFAYRQDTMYDDCCEEMVCWTLLPFKTELNTYYCDNCETNHVELDYSRQEFKDLRDRKEGRQIRYLDDQTASMIEKSLGHELVNGEYIDATFEVTVITPDSILLGDNDEQRN